MTNQTTPTGELTTLRAEAMAFARSKVDDAIAAIDEARDEDGEMPSVKATAEAVKALAAAIEAFGRTNIKDEDAEAAISEWANVKPKQRDRAATVEAAAECAEAISQAIDDAADEADEADEEADEADEESRSQMAATLARYRNRYAKVTKPNGKKTQDKDDAIAQRLREFEPEEVCAIADKVFNQPFGTHADKYAGLNPGQKRMNSGNRIRAAFKKADAEGMARIETIISAMALTKAEAAADEELPSQDDLDADTTGEFNEFK